MRTFSSLCFFSLALAFATGCAGGGPSPDPDAGDAPVADGGDPSDAGPDTCEPHDDEFTISQVTVSRDFLTVDVSYSGGCEDHDFRIGWDGIMATSEPGIVPVEIHHNANGDSCEAEVQDTLHIDLSGFTPPVRLDLLLSDGATLDSVLYEGTEPEADLPDDLLPVEAECSFLQP